MTKPNPATLSPTKVPPPTTHVKETGAPVSPLCPAGSSRLKKGELGAETLVDDPKDLTLLEIYAMSVASVDERINTLLQERAELGRKFLQLINPEFDPVNSLIVMREGKYYVVTPTPNANA